MSPTRAHEAGVLAGPEARLARAAQTFDGSESARLDILEAVASRIGGFDLESYRQLRSNEAVVPLGAALQAAHDVLDGLQHGPIHPSLALTALARPPLEKGARRKTGAYYTDFRLAQMLAQKLPADVGLKVLDPASGTGILLVAVALQMCGFDRPARARFLRESVHASDLSAIALRGAALSLASLTDDLEAIRAMMPRLRCTDSLLDGADGWNDVAPQGFPVIIGNPPWEKLKLNRHEFILARGGGGHYGAEVRLEDREASELAKQREELADYVTTVSRGFTLQGSGEPDLYKLFLELGFQLASPGGHVALLLPAGVIRSQGTEHLRRFVMDSATNLELVVLENRARFFAIDTRFKFLALHAVLGDDCTSSPILLQHAAGTPDGIDIEGEVRIGRGSLRATRPDLSIPEVRTPKEWSIFRRMTERGARLHDDTAPWHPQIVREVDMTRDRSSFRREACGNCVPVVEGRMVHQHRFGAKAYLSGTGRRAIWEPVNLGVEQLAPQFWIPTDDLKPSVAERTRRTRIGFCDVTGQTNERSLLAARIPAGVVCGNKVPTIEFGSVPPSSDDQVALGDLWLAMANSLAVDWYARRILTTTLNYFILLSLPFPAVDPAALPAKRLVALVRGMEVARSDGDLWLWGDLRAEIDARVLGLYGLDLQEVQTILEDFPLLDRGQPPLPGECLSTITRDVVCAHVGQLTGNRDDETEKRVAAARGVGAHPYVPAEWAGLDADSKDDADYG